MRQSAIFSCPAQPEAGSCARHLPFCTPTPVKFFAEPLTAEFVCAFPDQKASLQSKLVSAMQKACVRKTQLTYHVHRRTSTHFSSTRSCCCFRGRSLRVSEEIIGHKFDVFSPKISFILKRIACLQPRNESWIVVQDVDVVFHLRGTQQESQSLRCHRDTDSSNAAHCAASAKPQPKYGCDWLLPDLLIEPQELSPAVPRFRFSHTLPNCIVTERAARAAVRRCPSRGGSAADARAAARAASEHTCRQGCELSYLISSTRPLRARRYRNSPVRGPTAIF